MFASFVLWSPYLFVVTWSVCGHLICLLSPDLFVVIWSVCGHLIFFWLPYLFVVTWSVHGHRICSWSPYPICGHLICLWSPDLFVVTRSVCVYLWLIPPLRTLHPETILQLFLSTLQKAMMCLLVLLATLYLRKSPL